MAIRFNAFDPDNNGIGILTVQYLTQKFAAFDNVAGRLSTDTASSEYAFLGRDGGGIVFHSATGWTVDPVSGEVAGTLDTISFGQQTTVGADGTFSQATLELSITGLEVSDHEDLNALFEMASDGDFGYFGYSGPTSLYSILDTHGRTVTGSPGQDSLVGSSFTDTIRGGGGNDRLYSGNYSVGDGDRMSGGAGNDKILGGRGNDVIYGDSGNDLIRGIQGNDIIKAGEGNDFVRGDSGDDRLWGGDGDDFLSGGRGNDLIHGGHGNDQMLGGSSIDTFVFEKDAGDDVIMDFKPGKAGKDLIVFHDVGLNSFEDVMDHAVKIPGGVMITYDEGSLFLKRVQLSQLDSHDFSFS